MKKRVRKKKTGKLRKQHNYIFYVFFYGGTKLPAWPKISPIDGSSRDIGWVGVGGGGGQNLPPAS